MNQKINECGWFYHAPERRKVSQEPIEVPITSQIPGLSELPPEFDEKPRELYFKDTDTKYIRLAKQGGRKDLLVFKDHAQKPREARGYPRVDWFYLEDNAAEEDSQKKDTNWQFLLPEYMVHEQQQPAEFEESDSYIKQRRAPYAFDSTTVFQREGDTVTDKTVKLPELRQPGYGVRISRPPPPAKKQGPPKHERRLGSGNSQGEVKHGRRKQGAQPIVEDKTAMNKLLSFAYDKEWHAKQTNGQVSSHDHQESEYTENFRKLSAASNKPRRENSNRKPDSPKKEKVVSKPPVNQPEEKEPFILSKFKNVPARIDTHQKPDSHRHQ